MNAPANLIISEATAAEQKAWESFVLAAPGATYSHRWEWADLINRIYRLPTRRLVARDGDTWLAVFPVTLAPALPGRKRRGVSLAYCLYGDVLLRGNSTVPAETVRRAFLGELQRQGVSVVQTRSLEQTTGEAPEMTFLLDLPGDEKQLWQQVGDKARNQVRKAQRNGLAVQWGWEHLDAFQQVYATNMGRLGTPAHSRDFFAAHAELFGPDAELLTVVHDGRVIAGMLLIRFRDTWVNPIASSLPGMQQNNPNMLMYWEALNTANGRGIKRFDFGRSALGSGTQRFKKQWGALPYPLHHRTYVGGESSGENATQVYRGLAGRSAARAWSWLPGGLQQTLGPRLRRWML